MVSVWAWYYARDLIGKRPPDVPLHCVAVSNRGSDGQLLGYVEFFGFHRMVLCRADTYHGPDVHASYALNPMTGHELAMDLDLTLSRDEVAATCAYERIPDGSREDILGGLFPVAQKLSFEREKDRAILRAFLYAMEAWSTRGRRTSGRERAAFSRIMAEQMMPFFTRHLIRSRNG